MAKNLTKLIFPSDELYAYRSCISHGSHLGLLHGLNEGHVAHVPT